MVLAVLDGEPMAAEAARVDGAASTGVGGGCPKLVRLGVALAPRAETKRRAWRCWPERRGWDPTRKDRFPSHKARVVRLERYAVTRPLLC